MAEDPSTSSDESWDGALPRVLSTCNNVQETSLDIGQFFIEDIDGLLVSIYDCKNIYIYI